MNTLIWFLGLFLFPQAPQELSDQRVVLVFAGDVVLSDHVESYVQEDADYVFSLWKPGADADVFMVNLEHPITLVSEKVPKQFNFKMHPRFIRTLISGGVSIVHAANNHIADYGREGMLETMRLLDSAGIRYVGIGRNSVEARTPVIMNVKGLRIGFLGYYGGGEFAASKTTAGIAPRTRSLVLRDIASADTLVDFLVVGFHWGVEKAVAPEPSHVRLAHSAVDAGADLIVGHHPHVLQGIEQYSQKTIAYSLGNFVFGGNGRHSYSTAVLRVELENDRVNVEVVPVTVEKWQPRPSDGRQKDSTLQVVASRSKQFQSTITFMPGAE
jgi:poly-gamma-glutamate synthesis protein (capsule biosynthesis protein)